MIEPPGFIIGGAPRSGTTWLYHVLDRHPSLFMAKPLQPEPKFFLVDELYERGLDHYRATWFSGVPEGVEAGEKSTNYLENAVVATRIHRHLPHVKLVFALREPAARAWSNWKWSRMNGLEHLSFEEAIRCEAEREANYPSELRYSRPHSYFSRGLYARHLRPFFEMFAPGRILCLRYEDFAEQPARVAAEAHEFVGVAPRSEDGEAVGKINSSEAAGVEATVLEALRERYVRPNQELAELLGPGFRGWDW